MNDRNDLFENAPVSKAVISMALPTILSMLVTIIYNMADTYFIGQTGDSTMVSAVSLASPVFLVFIAFSSLLGVGGSSVISRMLGMKREDKAKKVSSFCFYTAIGVGIVMGAAVLIGIEPLLKLIGTDKETYEYTKSYLTCIALGGPFVILSGSIGNIIRSEGAAKNAMIGNMVGTVVNIILDPIMILMFKWGVMGAAVATVIGNVIACVVYTAYFFKKTTLLSIKIKDYRLDASTIKDVLIIGFPSTVSSLLATVANILLNRILVSYGVAVVAGMGVAMKINTVAVYVLLGLSAGIQPLIGYNYGAGNKKRLISVFKFSSISAVVLGTVLTAIMVFAKEPLIRAFIDDADVIRYGMQILVALQMAGPILGLMFIGSGTIQAMGKALASFFLNLCRQGIIFIPVLYTLNYLFGMNGVIYTTAIADYASVIISYTICISVMRKMKDNS